MMNKDQKKNNIEEMTSKIENSKAVMVTLYQGLTMTQLDDIRFVKPCASMIKSVYVLQARSNA
mgnify:CR=1 FL=1